MSSLTTKITEIGISAILAGALIPVGLTMLASANTTGWTDTQTIMWGVVGLFLMVGVVLAVIQASKE
jgi:hypothetical protein